MFKKVNERLGDSKGQSMLEYILIVVFVVLVGIGAWKTFGSKIKEIVGGSTKQIVNEVNDSGAGLNISPPKDDSN